MQVLVKPCALCYDEKLDLHRLGVEVRKYRWELSLCCVAIMICKGSHLREGCLEHGSCKGVAPCSCGGAALCCMLAAGCPAHSAWLRQPCQPQWAFCFTGRFSLWKDASDGKLQDSLVCSGIMKCIILSR